MRLALGRAGIRRRAIWLEPSQLIPDKIRVLFSSPEMPDNYRYLWTPRRGRLKPYDGKNPSAATNKGRIVS